MAPTFMKRTDDEGAKVNEKKEMQTIHINLTLDEINQILKALGTQPYADVFQLINKIQMQAETQLNLPTPTDEDETPQP